MVIVASLMGVAASQRPVRLTPAMVRNSETCLPSLADPPDALVPFRNGQYSSASIPFARMRAMGSGTLDGQPAIVAEIVWNTGGSGNWEIIALYRAANGQAMNVGVYSPGPNLPDGGTMVGRIAIVGNRIRLFGEDPMQHRTIAAPLIVNASVF